MEHLDIRDRDWGPTNSTGLKALRAKQGRIHEIRGEYEQAVLSYEKGLEIGALKKSRAVTSLLWVRGASDRRNIAIRPQPSPVSRPQGFGPRSFRLVPARSARILKAV